MAEQALKIKKKKWFQLVAPALFNNISLGETSADAAEQVIGRTVTVNLATVTNDLRQQSSNLSFRVASVEGDKAKTEMVSYHTSPPSIRRLVRRGTTRIDERLNVELGDKSIVLMKIFMVTKAIVRSATASAIRKMLPQVLAKEAGKISYDDLIRSVASNRLQIAIKNHVKKVYPLKSCEIKSLELIKKGTGKVEQKAEQETKSEAQEAAQEKNSEEGSEEGEK